MRTGVIAASALVGLTFSSAYAGEVAVESESAEQEVVFDIEAGEALYKKNCRRCHGPTAKGLASYPKLVEQTPEYLIDKLERYRSGERFGPNTPLMAPNARKLSDDDIVSISYFIASIE